MVSRITRRELFKGGAALAIGAVSLWSQYNFDEIVKFYNKLTGKPSANEAPVPTAEATEEDIEKRLQGHNIHCAPIGNPMEYTEEVRRAALIVIGELEQNYPKYIFFPVVEEVNGKPFLTGLCTYIIQEKCENCFNGDITDKINPLTL